MQILFSGHNSCFNRGCEAFVRTSAQAFKQVWPQSQITLPTRTPADDAQALFDLGDYVHPQGRHAGLLERALCRAQQRHGLAALAVWPGPVPRRWHRALQGVDLVVAVGGDTYSLDYGVPSGIAGFDGVAATAGVPVVLWGASVGPFRALPAYERALARSLARYRLIGARESLTQAYLEDELGLTNVVAMIDPAFALAPEPLPASTDWLTAIGRAERVIGLNLSDLIAQQAGGEAALAAATAQWLQAVLSDPGTWVVLIPHVANPRQPGRSDGPFMRRVMAAADITPAQAARVVMAGEDWRAGQYKQLVAHCDVLLAARTHLTIAGFSQGIPTVSLGYSQKARGLNIDVYGTEQFHIAASAVSADSLQAATAAALSARETLQGQSLRYTREGQQRNEAVGAQAPGWLAAESPAA
jgi:colanic acid/amylovoran biosynthesis protein